MNCFSCFRSQRSMKSTGKKGHANLSSSPNSMKQNPSKCTMDQSNEAKKMAFTFRELATATKNFRQECLLGEGGYGRVYKGTLASTGQVVAVKQLDRHGLYGNKDFLSEVLVLSLLHHENLVNLIGYCADGDQRVLVYEFMAGGSLQEHLLDRDTGKKPLDWFTRMKIAYGAAKGLEYLHEKTDPPIIYRELNSSNILLDENLVPKLSDYGLAQLGPSGDKSPISSRVVGTYGYAAPEYQTSGHLTVKSDVYSFGVVFLEIITGRRAIDTTKPVDEQNLVTWAQPIFKDPKKFPDLADPLLEMRFPEKDLNQAVAIAAMCLQEEAAARPLISDVVTALSFLSVEKEIIVAARGQSVSDHGDMEIESRHSSRSSGVHWQEEGNQSEDPGSMRHAGSSRISSKGRNGSSKHEGNSISRSSRWSFQSNADDARDGVDVFCEMSSGSSHGSGSSRHSGSATVSRDNSISSCDRLHL